MPFTITAKATTREHRKVGLNYGELASLIQQAENAGIALNATVKVTTGSTWTAHVDRHHRTNRVATTKEKHND